MKTFFQFKILLLLSRVTDGLCGKGWKKEALKVLLENFWNIGWWPKLKFDLIFHELSELNSSIP